MIINNLFFDFNLINLDKPNAKYLAPISPILFLFKKIF